MKSFQDYISEMEVSASTLRAREQRDRNRENIKNLRGAISKQRAQTAAQGTEAVKKKREREEIKQEVEDELRREKGCE